MNVVSKGFIISGTPGKGEGVWCLKHLVTNVRSLCLGDAMNMQFVFRVSLLVESRTTNLKKGFVCSAIQHMICSNISLLINPIQTFSM